MARRVNFRALKQQISLQAILEHYGIWEQFEEKPSRSDFLGPCPIHRGDKPTFLVSLEKNAWRCFGPCRQDESLHNGGGNMFDLVRKIEGIETGDRQKDTRQAALCILGWSKAEQEDEEEPLDGESSPPDEEPPPREDRVNVPLTFALKNLDPEHWYLKDRGLTPETIEAFGCGYCTKGFLKGRVAVPVHTGAGELVAYVGYWPEDKLPEGEGRWKLPEPPKFYPSLEIFNLHRAQDAAREAEALILVPDCFSVMQLWQAGVKNAGTLLSHALSHEQVALIVRTIGQQGRVLVVADSTQASCVGQAGMLTKLAKRVYVKILDLREKHRTLDSLTSDEMNDLEQCS